MTLKHTENSAIIAIKNTKSAEDVTEATEVISEGRFYKSEGRFYIFYSEEETEQTVASVVQITVEKNRLIMSRKGAFSSRMEYEAGVANDFIYHTPFGDMQMRLKTKLLESDLAETGGRVHLCYSLIVNGEELSNDLTITVKSEGR